jgi:phospholipid transport system substrate-binding protein
LILAFADQFAITGAGKTGSDLFSMSLSRRALLWAFPLSTLTLRPAFAAPEAGPSGLIERFYADLLAVMKEAKRLSFAARYDRLAPSISRTFDLALMTRIAIGPGWAQIAADQQQRLTDVFSRYTISVYANRFDDFGGERFEVDAKPTAGPNGVIVGSRIIKTNGEPVALNYLMRQDASGAWKAIDVYLSGTISELATRRSEFVAVLQRGGADGLVRMIEQRTAALRMG